MNDKTAMEAASVKKFEPHLDELKTDEEQVSRVRTLLLEADALEEFFIDCGRFGVTKPLYFLQTFAREPRPWQSQRDWRTKMNDKTAMEAAREAAFKKASCEWELSDADDDFQEFAFKMWDAGWNARQPKPCVWTQKECPCCMTTQCGRNTAAVRFNKYSPYCSHCGGKIEVSE